MEAIRASGWPETVAVALDDTAASRAALVVARRLADQLGAHLRLLHLPVCPEPDLALAGSHLRHRAAGDRGAIARHGRTVSPILDMANDPATSLVTLGVGCDASLPGSVSSRVIQEVAGALLLVPSSSSPSEWLGLRRLLAPLDGAPSTFRALAPVVSLAARLGAALDLLYVADPAARAPAEPGTLALPTYLDQPQYAWDEWRREVVRTLASYADLSSLSVAVHISVATGALGKAILRRAAEDNADAIVVVHRGCPQPHGAPILRTLLDRAPCPILLVPVTTPAARPLRRWRPT